MGILLGCLDLTQVAALVTTALTLVLAWFLVVPLAHWRRKGIPHVSAVPFFGSLTDSFFQRTSIGEDYERIYHQMEGKRYAGFHKFLKPSILLRDPEIIKEILVKDFSSFHDNDFDVTLSMDPMMGRNLFFMHGDLWRRVRSSLSPAFSSGKVKSFMPLILEVCEDLRGYLKEDGDRDVELKELCARFTTNVVAFCAFGIKIDALRQPDELFRRMGLKILEPTGVRGIVQLVVMNIPILARVFRVPFIPTEVADFFRQVVRNVASAREKSGELRNDFLNMLLVLKGAGKLGANLAKEDDVTEEGTEKMKKSKELNFGKILADPESLDDVTAQAIGFFLDGYETSSILISFTLFELAHNQSVQERLRAEVEDIKSLHRGSISYEALQDMPYLEKVLQESMRKYPPIPFIVRRCTKQYHLPVPEESTSKEAGGFWLETGTPVIVPIYALHRDPKHFANPEVFDPERFSKDARREGLNYLPFGGGPRMCIGNRFGVLQSKAAIAAVVSNFNLTPTPIELDPKSLLLLSKRKLWVKLERIRH